MATLQLLQPWLIPKPLSQYSRRGRKPFDGLVAGAGSTEPTVD